MDNEYLEVVVQLRRRGSNSKTEEHVLSIGSNDTINVLFDKVQYIAFLDYKPVLYAVYPFSSTSFQLFPGTQVSDLRLPNPAHIIADLDECAPLDPWCQDRDFPAQPDAHVRVTEVVSLLSDSENGENSAMEHRSPSSLDEIQPWDPAVYKISRGKRRRMRQDGNPPHALYGTLVNIPDSILQDCERPERAVFIQQGCMQDFQYSATLMMPRRVICDALRVLNEGAQCRVFAGTYGIDRRKGRGVIALEPIKQGQCILEYAGELVYNDEAKQKDDRYTFDVARHHSDKENEELVTYKRNGKPPTAICAAQWGNVARLLNHSCCPNLQVLDDTELVKKVIQTHGLYHVIFQAKRDIGPGEELVIDYHPEWTRSDLEKMSTEKIRCHCGSRRYCKDWLAV